jgi:hypothetical protein
MSQCVVSGGAKRIAHRDEAARKKLQRGRFARRRFVTAEKSPLRSIRANMEV